MSLDETELSADEVLEVRAGTRIPFTMVGDWVLLSRMSAPAKLLYTLLAAHVNVSEGDRKVWPSLGTLAELMGLQNARSVSRYVDELETFGAITKVQHRSSEGLRTRNSYYVNGEPPVGIRTPTRFADYYAARATARRADTVSAGGSVVRPRTPRPDQAKRKPAGQAVVSPGVLRSANEHGPVVLPRSPELDEELQLDEDQNPPPKSERRPPVHGHAPAASAPADELALIPAPPQASSAVVATAGGMTAGDAVAAWADTFRAEVGAEPTAQQRGQVAREAKQLLIAGNPPARVISAVRSAARRGFATVTREYSDLSAAALGRSTARPAAPRPSTTDQRVSAGLALAARYAAEEAGQ